MQDQIKTAQKISSECWNAFKTFMNSEHRDEDWEEYLKHGNKSKEYQGDNHELFCAMFLGLMNYAESKVKEQKHG